MANSKRYKAVFLLLVFLFNSFFPPVAMALTGGPSQPEVQSFEPASTSEMVDLSSGSFTYNIPLMDVGGYPLNLAYDAGATMDQEASCVGLGWNINPGVISRNMRGMPDDFNGDEMNKEFSLKPNKTWGGSFGFDFEVFGFDKAKPSLQAGVFYNNYKGVGLDFGVSANPSLMSAQFSKGKLTGDLGLALNLNLNSQNGASAGAAIKPSVSFGEMIDDRRSKEFSLSGGLNYNSKQGLQAATLSASMDFQGTITRTRGGKKDSKSFRFAQTLGSSTFSFARPTFLPSADMSVSNFSFTFRGALETPAWGFDAGTSISGYYSRQQLANKKLTTKGYGTLYLENRQSGTCILDFNREKDGPFTKNTPNLAVPVPAQDIYTVTGQGIGGSYLLKRSDIGMFSDRESVVKSGSGTLGLEVGAANLAKFGLDVVGVGVEAKESAWKDLNDLAPNLPFKGGTAGTLYEPAYFKPAGEQVVESDTTLFKNIGGFEAVDAKISKVSGSASDKFNIKVNSEFRMGNTLKSKPVTGQLSRANRERRNQNISYLAAQDAAIFGLQRNIENYPLNNFLTPPQPIQRVDNTIRKKSHISEISTLREDGVRYVYGVPAYNRKQQDYQFSVANSGDCGKGLVTYTPTERSKTNNSGRDNYYSMEETPPYAHSYLLTAVLSPDYSDVDAVNGPSSGDIGSYTKFNYSRVFSNYKWRLPFPDKAVYRANYNPGLLSDTKDNRASIIYGEKEMWHVHSIESKTYVARFYYGQTQRQDAYGVSNVDGVLNGNGTSTDLTQRMVRLDSIVLYSKADLSISGAGAIPIKKVTFIYNQSLSKNVPNTENGSQGKLTLIGLYFTYGRSSKGRFSPYTFEYNGAAIMAAGTPGTDSLAYNYLAYNRWGNFQRSSKTTSTGCNTSDNPGNDESPYVIQDSLQQAKYAVAWNLTGIVLPSGGRIDVAYESHDYAYTQNKNAMEMFQITGMGADSLYNVSTDQLFSPDPAKISYPVVFFKLKSSMASFTAQQAKDIIGRDYLKDIAGGNLYFKCLINLKSTLGPGCGASGCPHYEYVYGYGGITNWGKCPDNGNYGFIRLKAACLKDKQKSSCTYVNPIAKAGWQFTRLYYPDLIHQSNLATALPADQPTSISAFLSVVEAFADLFKGLEVALSGMNAFCLQNNFSQKLERKKSWIRLYNPGGIKLAGGSRVKRIKISDNWEVMSTVKDNGAYGQEFTYRTEVELGKKLADNLTKREISSGVASYEPMIGGDENPFRQPETYDEALKLAPDNHYYQEAPFGESFFPSPQIVYSKVKVTNLRYNNSGILVTPTCVSTGTTVNEFYTAKDFPTRVTKTPIQVIAAKSSPLVSMLRLDYKDYLNASQGFCVELNDMHGKPKAQWNYDDKGQRVSGMEYLYKTKKKDSDPSPSVTKLVSVPDSLDNRVTVINRDGTVATKQIGIDFQMIADSRESGHETRTRGVALNVDVMMFGIFPAVAIVPWPVWETEKTRFRSVAITKIINRYAVLEKVVAYDASSRIETENLAYDAETGEVLLTRTYNEFGDPLYKLKYPAHFAYKGMRQAYENAGVEVTAPMVTSLAGDVGSSIQLNSTTIKFFEPGDVLKIADVDTFTVMRAWVLNVNTTNNMINVIDSLGRDLPFAPPQPVNVKVLRSGKRNQQSFEIGSVTMRTNPIQGTQLIIPSTAILGASSTEYSDFWMYQNIGGCTTFDGVAGESRTAARLVPPSVSNPYNFGRRGSWRTKRTWAHLKDRIPASPTATYQTNIRTDGTYPSYSSFWVSQISGVWSRDTTNWTWSSEATKYNNYGFQLESRDRLNRYSAELPGYNNTQAIAVAANARYREIHFDGFEENNLDFMSICPGITNPFRHFPVLSGGSVDPAYSHTGDYSLRVNAGGTAANVDGAITAVPISADGPILESSTETVTPGASEPAFHVFVDTAYLVSAWVRTNETYAQNKLTYKQGNELNPRIEVSFKNNFGTPIGTTLKLHPSGPVIDGWQRITGLFTYTSVLGGAQGRVNFAFKNGTTNIAYFDDFRIQPFRSSMKSYVYDLKSTRLLATLDDENYATFYEYDQEGMLERVKRETERGVMTVQETRKSTRKP